MQKRIDYLNYSISSSWQYILYMLPLIYVDLNTKIIDITAMDQNLLLVTNENIGNC